MTLERRIILVVFAAVLAVLWAMPGEAASKTARAMLEAAEKSRARLLQDEEAQRLRHNWLNVIEKYGRAAEEYEGGQVEAAALLAQGDLFLGLFRRSRREADADAAVAAYRALLRRHPQDERAPRAQLAVGQVYYYVKKDLDRAYMELLKVELNHPRAKEEVAAARKIMTKISGRRLATPAEPPAAARRGSPESSGGERKAESRVSAVKAPPASVVGLRHWSNPTYSRVVVDLNEKAAFRDHLLRPDPSLKKPMRLYLDIHAGRIGREVPEEKPIADGLLERARVGQYNPETVRVVLDIQHIENYRVFSLNDPYRIVVDVTGSQSRPGEQQTARRESDRRDEPRRPLADLRETALKREKQPRGRVKKLDDSASLARQLGLGVRRIVLDPGHGGKDRGATGVDDSAEKDLTLKVARLLEAKIEKRLGLEAALTRDDDEFLTLEERTARANTEGADMFISIHANAHKSPKITGLETYILNVATDKEAMRVAAMENATTTRNMSDLQLILADLMLNSKINESGRLGDKVHKNMVKHVRRGYKNVRDLGVKQAPFYVLIGANMPSILVELGFMTNKTEAARLRSQKYLDHLTDGIVEGIRAYVESTRPEV